MKFQISIDRRSESFAVFDSNCKCVCGFQPYGIEAAAVMKAKAWIEEHYPGTNFNTEVEVVYPRITKITMSTRGKHLAYSPENNKAILDEMLPRKRFFLSQDQSCHWHMVDASKRKEWEAWNDLSEDDPKGWETPPYARMLGSGPHLVEFENPTGV